MKVRAKGDGGARAKSVDVVGTWISWLRRAASVSAPATARLGLVLVGIVISLVGIMGVINPAYPEERGLEEVITLENQESNDIGRPHHEHGEDDEHEEGVARLCDCVVPGARGDGAGSDAGPRACRARPGRRGGAAAAAAPVPITDADIKGSPAPKPEDKAKGDPAGTITGTVGDIPVGDAKKGLTIADVVNAVGQNLIATNFVWTLVTGFLVMFMQAGFAIVETGLARAKNANHTMMMNFMVYGVGMLAYWLIGFAIQEGGVGAVANLGGTAPLSSEFAIHLFGKDWGLFGQKGIMLGGATYDVGVMVMFLFQMVFMDTALTIVTGTAAERWKYSAFIISSFFMGAFTYPLFANWAWGGGWLATLGSSYGLGHGYSDFAGSGVVHAVGGITALAMAIIIGPRIGKFSRDGKPNAIPGHDIVIVLLGCFILAFGWFGFNPGSTLGAAANGNLRISSVAVNTMLAGMAGSFGAMYYMWIRYGKPDASMTGNGLLAGLVAITAPSGFVNPMGVRSSSGSSPACWCASRSNSSSAS